MIAARLSPEGEDHWQRRGILDRKTDGGATLWQYNVAVASKEELERLQRDE